MVLLDLELKYFLMLGIVACWFINWAARDLLLSLNWDVILGFWMLCSGFPTLKLFSHGVPIEYTGPRKADLLVRFLKKFVAPDVSLLESDSAVQSFVEAAGTHFPIFIGFGVNESLIVELASKYKKKAWFSVVKGFSEDIMITYDFDKVPALVSLHPAYNEQSVFYGPFEGVLDRNCKWWIS